MAMTIVETRPITGGGRHSPRDPCRCGRGRPWRHARCRVVPTTTDGFAELHAWLRGFGPLERAGVEGTGAYGAGLARHLRGVGVVVIEVDRPSRQARRRHGKSDSIDAVKAARAALSGRAHGL